MSAFGIDPLLAPIIARRAVARPAPSQFEAAGLRMPIKDSYIAATARRHGLTIVTGDDRHFRRRGLKVFNPFKELP